MAPSHPDHRAVGSAALDAIYPDARNPFAFPELREDEGLAAWTVREVFLVAGPVPNHFVDITATFGRKVAALRAHDSQTGHWDDLEGRIRAMLGRIAAQADLPDGRLAEAFQVLDAS
jgi:LmbE family N-acetylglucosaminyl deacetylase